MNNQRNARNMLGTKAQPAPRRKKIGDNWYDIHAKRIRDARSLVDVWVFPKQFEVLPNGELKCSEWTEIASSVKDAPRNVQEWVPVLHRADDLEGHLEEGSRWLWENRLPRADVCILAGCAGQGKSLIAIDAAARVTRGDRWPDEAPGQAGSAEPGDVLIINTEDSEATTLERLRAAGADLSRVFLLSELTPVSGDMSQNIPVNIAHTDCLEKLILQLDDCKLLIIDTIAENLPPNFNSNSESSVRQIMRPLRLLARKHEVSVLLPCHTGKTKKRAVHAPLGSTSWGASVRHMLLTEEGEEKGSFLLCVGKSNLGSTRDATRYTIELSESGTPVVAIDHQRQDISADEALSRRGTDQEGPFHPGARGPEPKKLNDAAAWLMERLADGPVPSTVIGKESEEHGIRPATLKNARKRLNVNSERLADGAFYMRLPDAPDCEVLEEASPTSTVLSPSASDLEVKSTVVADEQSAPSVAAIE
ncbi:MAG: AAA family ATPase [Phycisphaeraceae bacterium]|nr:AAA family ATPase [Phycisphaeraceae bacterium]